MEDRAAAERWLKASQYFLQHRDLDGCRNYALRAQQSSAHHPSIPQLLAVADVLTAAGTLISGTHSDWYSILQVPRFSQDTTLITHKFNHLINLLNPSTNKFPFAGEAFELVCNAWSVLSNHVKRCRFDSLIRGLDSDECCFENDNVFWTICPYCYFVYEYARVYVDCCLRCQNEKCGRSFHAVEIRSPPMEVVESGQYKCNGFYPLGFGGGGGGGGGEGFSPWTPFVPVGSCPEGEVKVKEKKSMPEGDNDNDNVGGRDSFIEITDDSGDNFESEVVNKNARVFKDNVDEVEVEKVKQRSVQMEVPDIVKPVMKKKKSVAKATKKLMGRGTRIDKQETVAAQSGEELDLNAEATSEDGQDFGSRFVGGLEIGSGDEFVVGGVQFFEGDDDVFVDLQDGF